MKKLSLNIDQQNELVAAYTQLDSHEVVTPGIEKGAKPVRVPYKLGAQRRAIVKNMNALRTSLREFNETQKGIFKECFPDVPDGDSVDLGKQPENGRKYREAMAEVLSKKDEFDLLPLPEKVIYEDNEMPLAAVAVLDQHGLIA